MKGLLTLTFSTVFPPLIYQHVSELFPPAHAEAPHSF